MYCLLQQACSTSQVRNGGILIFARYYAAQLQLTTEYNRTSAPHGTHYVHTDTPGDIKAGKSATQNQPYYPAKAQAGRIEGVVRASYTVNTKGCAENIKIVSAQPADVFEKETIRAMKKWCGMNPTLLPKIITITFRLNGGASMEEVPLTVDK
ncbi:TonB family protein [Enterobacteriaceae bacterium H4N4]|uniref:Protein TonB n=1 Tax=Silvania confinis TaxID=2926470 RepID=A0A9J6QDD4_9ENTR|nr:TonB family protein [Silvania confinis]MCU6668259.1 TonB family protein [Silvania confinis]